MQPMDYQFRAPQIELRENQRFLAFLLLLFQSLPTCIYKNVNYNLIMKFVKYSVHVFDICWKSSGLLIQKLQVRISLEATFCIVCFDKYKLGFRTLPFQLKRGKLLW